MAILFVNPATSFENVCCVITFDCTDAIGLNASRGKDTTLEMIPVKLKWYNTCFTSSSNNEILTEAGRWAAIIQTSSSDLLGPAVPAVITFLIWSWVVTLAADIAADARWETTSGIPVPCTKDKMNVDFQSSNLPRRYWNPYELHCNWTSPLLLQLIFTCST